MLKEELDGLDFPAILKRYGDARQVNDMGRAGVLSEYLEQHFERKITETVSCDTDEPRAHEPLDGKAE